MTPTTSPLPSKRPSSKPNEARPLLKWAGGKRKLAGRIIELLFERGRGQIARNYVEPFVGAGAVFFELAKSVPPLVGEYVLGDSNEELMTVYRVVQRTPEA